MTALEKASERNYMAASSDVVLETESKRNTALTCAVAVATVCTNSHACQREPWCTSYSSSPAGPTWVVQSICSEQHGPPRQARLGADGPALPKGHTR